MSPSTTQTDTADVAGGRHVAVTVPPMESQARLDVWLAGELGEKHELSRSRIQALIKAGYLRRDGRICEDPKTKLRGGETLHLALPAPEAALPAPEAIPLSILFEDGDVLVIDKPVGMVVHPGAGVRTGTLVNAVLHHCPNDLSGIGGVARPGIVHRLDRDTSGVMVVAKNDAAHRHLSAQFADHGRTGPMERSYLALAWGRPVPPAGRIDLMLGRDPRDRTRRAVSSAADARHAITRYATERTFEIATLLRCTLETGRTHQIRVHLAAIGHPLLGDDAYGATHRSKAARLPPAAQEALKAMEGQALHAASLAFVHPRTEELMRFDAPLPKRFQALADSLASN